MNKSIENDGTEVLIYLKKVLDDFVIELDELKQKQRICEQSAHTYEKKLAQLKGKVDSNHDFFSPSSKSIDLEKGKIELELKMIQLDIENYKNQIEILLKKVDMMNKVSKYIEPLSKCQEEIDKLRDNNNRNLYGLQILETQENERTRIARELHDSTVQNLTNLVHKTELCLKLSDIDLIRTKLELHTMIETIRSTINDMREIIYDLRPMSIDDLGLVVTIERYIKQIMCGNNLIHIDFSVKNEEVKVKPVINITLFRIVQEACNNVIEHAKADHIGINLEYLKSSIQITIFDNGIGIEESKKSKKKSDISFGVSIMKERAYLMSGIIEITSEEDKGTKIFVAVPF